MKRLIMLILLSVVSISLVGCASMDDLRNGMNAIDSFWGETNEKYLSKYGNRSYPVDINTSVNAMNSVMDNFGYNLTNEYKESSTELHITYKGIAPSPLSKDEFKKVKMVEEPMMQAIAANEVGSFTSSFFVLSDGDDFELVVKVDFKEVDSITNIKFNFNMYYREKDTYKIYGEYPPPEAVKIAMSKTWGQFETQLKNITGKQLKQI